jgi:hypothetical protein
MPYKQLGAYIRSRIAVSDKDLNIILSHFKPVQRDKNDLLLSAGQTSQNSYFVDKGCLRIYYINEEGKDVTRYIAFENQFATALVSLLPKCLRQNTYRLSRNRSYYISVMKISII